MLAWANGIRQTSSHCLSNNMCASRLSNIMCACRLACLSASVSARQEPTNHEKTPTCNCAADTHSFLGCSTDTATKATSLRRQCNAPQQNSVQSQRIAMYTTDTPCPCSFVACQVSCSSGHSLPRTDEPTVCMVSNGRPCFSNSPSKII